MSTQVNTYVLYGVLLPYVMDSDDRTEPYEDNPFHEETNPKDGITVLADGMNGEYLAIGHVIAKTRDGEGFAAPVALAQPTVNWEVIWDLVEALGVDRTTINPGWFVISHYR